MELQVISHMMMNFEKTMLFFYQDEDKVEERGLSPDTSETDSLQSRPTCSGGVSNIVSGALSSMLSPETGQGRRKSSVCPQTLQPVPTLLRFESQAGSTSC